MIKYLIKVLILLSLFGCSTKDSYEEFYNNETELDFSFRIVKNSNRLYVALQKNNPNALILFYRNTALVTETTTHLNLKEVYRSIENIKSEILLEKVCTNKYSTKNNCQITFFINYGTNQIERTYVGMQEKDLPRHLKELVDLLKTKNYQLKNF